MSYGNERAPEGQIYVCKFCGKRSRDLYGKEPLDRGWDESCMLAAVLCWWGGPPWRAVEEKPCS